MMRRQSALPAAAATGGTEAAAPSPQAAAPAQGEPEVAAGLLALLRLEAEAREAGSRRRLLFLIADETRKLTRARQIFVCLPGRLGRPRIEVISGLAAVERNAPLVQWLEAILAGLSPPGEVRELELAGPAGGAGTPAETYPFRHAAWLPFAGRGGRSRGGMLLAREVPWSEGDLVVARRLAGTYAHALSELSAPTGAAHWRPPVGWLAAGLIAFAAGLMLLPVPMKALAPFEIVPRDPFVVAAPIEGIIERIEVEPSQPVTAGQPLLGFLDTVLRNRLEVAERELLVAEAKVRKSTQLAFDDVRGRQDLNIAMAELRLRTAERDFARELLEMSVVRAPRSGIAVYAGNNELIGRPFTVGERIMQIADAARVEVAIDLPVADAIVLEGGATASLYFDSDPLRPRAVSIVRSDYQARPRAGNVLAFRIVARLADGEVARLGLRGTAQLQGRTVPLGFYLFRRPLAALRQWLGL